MSAFKSKRVLHANGCVNLKNEIYYLCPTIEIARELSERLCFLQHPCFTTPVFNGFVVPVPVEDETQKEGSCFKVIGEVLDTLSAAEFLWRQHCSQIDT